MTFIHIFLQLTFGMTVFIRILDFLKTKNHFSKVSLTKIGTFYIVWMFIGVKILTLSKLFVFFWLQIPNIILLFTAVGLDFSKNKKNQSNLLLLLSQLILELKVGHSFRTALHKICNNFPQKQADFIENVCSDVVFSQQKLSKKYGSETKKFIFELQKIDKNPHQAVQRCEALYQQLKMMESFRHKSGQILNQTYLQIIIMTALYLTILVFVTFRFGWEKHLSLITISLLLFSLGNVWVYYLGRSFKWKL